jgi:hypothetical protein
MEQGDVARSLAFPLADKVSQHRFAGGDIAGLLALIVVSRRRRKRSMAGGSVSCPATRMGHSRRADTGSAN